MIRPNPGNYHVNRSAEALIKKSGNWPTRFDPKRLFYILPKEYPIPFLMKDLDLSIKVEE